MTSRTTLLILAVTLPILVACGQRDAPPIHVENAPSEADRIAAERALRQDFESLVAEPARAVMQAEAARNDALEVQSGGVEAAKAAECESLGAELQKLESLLSSSSPSEMSAEDRVALPGAIEERQARFAATC